MDKELQKAKAEIERLKCSLDDKDYIIKSQWGETETLKALISELQNKILEAENGVKSDGCQRGDVLEELVDRQRKVEDQLKWKVEQFKHLEEAHEKLRDQFRASRTEWDTEKSLLVDEISKLQDSLDDGNRTAEGFKTQLAMCRQALENEESRRIRLEEQVSEMKSLLENESHEGFGGKMEGEYLAAEGGVEEIANLKHSLRVLEMDYKDMEYKARKLERENQELLTSIRELQEAHIPRAVPTPSSWAKLKTRLKSLEQNHKECSANLRAKEVEWNSKTDKMNQELIRCSSNLKIKDQVIEELNKELEGCNSSLTQLKMQNEELSLMLQLMRSEGAEDIEGSVAQLMEQLEKERQEKLGIQEDLDKLRVELENLHDALDAVNSEGRQGGAGQLMEQLEKERQEKLGMQGDLDQLREELEEGRQGGAGQLMEQLEKERQEKFGMQGDLDKLREELEELHDALQVIDSELTDQANEKSELEYELRNWISIAAQLEMQATRSQAMRIELELSLLEQAEVEEMLRRDTEKKDRRISNLEQQIYLMDQEIRVEEDDTTEEDEKVSPSLQEEEDVRVSPRVQMDDEQVQLELLTEELDEAIVGHIMEEKNYTFDHVMKETLGPAQKHERTRIDLEVCASKENVSQQHSHLRKTSETIIEERSPFRELN